LDIDNWTIEELRSLIDEFKNNQENMKNIQVLADTNTAKQFDSYKGDMIFKISIRSVDKDI